MNNCEEYWSLISASLDSALTPEEQARLDAHLRECPECRAMVDDLTAAQRSLAALESPAPGFADRVMAQVAETEQDIPFTALPRNRKTDQAAKDNLRAWWKPLRTVLALAACFALILGVGRAVGALDLFRMGSAAPAEQAVNGDMPATSAADNAVPEEAPAAAEPDDMAPAEAVPEAAAEDSAAAGADGEAVQESAARAEELIIDGRTYSLRETGLTELPGGFTPAGNLTLIQAAGTDLVGAEYFTSALTPGTIYVADWDTYQRWES